MNTPWNGAWTGAWGMSPPAGIQPPAVPTGPKLASLFGGGGYTLGGGPYGTGATTPANAPASATGQVKSRELAGMFGGYGTKALGQTGLNVGAALAAGFAPSVGDVVGSLAGNLASPGSMAGLAGSVAAKTAGFTNPTGPMGTFARALNPALAIGLGLMSPALGLGYAALSPFGMDALGDMTNSRKDEKHKDAMEDAHGFFGGRVASRDLGAMAQVGGFGSLESMGAALGYGPADMARGMTNKDATAAMSGRNPMGTSYGGWGGVGGPDGGARAVDRGYGPSMGGWGGLGIGNPSSYGGGGNSSGGGSGGKSGGGGYGGHAGGKDGSSTGFGR